MTETNLHDMNRKKSKATKEHYYQGTDAPWYQAQKLTEQERELFRTRSKESYKAKKLAMEGNGSKPIHKINIPLLKPEVLMPKKRKSGLAAISLFSGCGGLDIGFDLAGFAHLASYEILEPAAQTIKSNKPDWNVFFGDDGDVRHVNWKKYIGKVDVIHGGPPCQPFSMAGKQMGHNDSRNMFPEFIRAVLEAKPRAFVAENVASLASLRFSKYVSEHIIKPLSKSYEINVFKLKACDFGVPQSRTRLFFVGFLKNCCKSPFSIPVPTHYYSNGKYDCQSTLFNESETSLRECLGARKALGLPDIGYDDIAPTIRSGLSGPRHTTSILSSTAALKKWNTLQIWPNGVAESREKAHLFVAKNKHFRLSVQDCAVLQGFPEYWKIKGPVYMSIGMIGNSVAPPVAYNLALAIKKHLSMSLDNEEQNSSKLSCCQALI